MTLIGSASALAVGLVLLAAGVGHLRDPRGLRRALVAHRVLPTRPMRRYEADVPLSTAHRSRKGTSGEHGAPLGLVAALLGPVEIVLGAGLVLLPAIVAGSTGAGRPALGGLLLGATLLTAGFTAYLTLVLRRTRGEEIPCGCGLGTTPVGPWAVARAALLTGLALTALLAPLTTGTPATDAPAWAQGLVAGAAGLSLALAVAALPAARALPSGLTTLHAGGAR